MAATLGSAAEAGDGEQRRDDVGQFAVGVVELELVLFDKPDGVAAFAGEAAAAVVATLDENALAEFAGLRHARAGEGFGHEEAHVLSHFRVRHFGHRLNEHPQTTQAERGKGRCHQYRRNRSGTFRFRYLFLNVRPAYAVGRCLRNASDMLAMVDEEK